MAQPGETALLLALVVQFHRHEGLEVPPDRLASALGELLSDPGLGFVLVAVGATQVLGYAVVTAGYSLEFHGRDFLVDELYVRPDAQGKGLGSALLGAAEQEAKRRGGAALHLEVGHANVRALELYRRHGYKDHGRFLLTKWMTD